MDQATRDEDTLTAKHENTLILDESSSLRRRRASVGRRCVGCQILNTSVQVRGTNVTR